LDFDIHTLNFPTKKVDILQLLSMKFLALEKLIKKHRSDEVNVCLEKNPTNEINALLFLTERRQSYS